MFYVYKNMIRKLFTISFFCFLTIHLFAQRQKVKNQPYVDQKLYHFGFGIGMHSQDMILNNSGYINDDWEIWFCEIPNYSAGLSVSLIADLYLNPYMNLRFTPTMHFGEKKFQFKEENSGEKFNTVVKSSYLNFPLDIKFSSLRINNYRPYLLAGAYCSVDLGRQKEMPILLKPLDYGLEFGIGCDFYLPIIKVCPEIKFCFGLTNLIEKDRSDLRDKSLLKYTEAFSGGKSRMIVLTFSFE